MSNWRIPMPLTEPDDGKAHVVLSIKGKGAHRMEIIGQFDRSTADEIFSRLVAIDLIESVSEVGHAE